MTKANNNGNIKVAAAIQDQHEVDLAMAAAGINLLNIGGAGPAPCNPPPLLPAPTISLMDPGSRTGRRGGIPLMAWSSNNDANLKGSGVYALAASEIQRHLSCILAASWQQAAS